MAVTTFEGAASDRPQRESSYSAYCGGTLQLSFERSKTEGQQAPGIQSPASV